VYVCMCVCVCLCVYLLIHLQVSLFPPIPSHSIPSPPSQFSHHHSLSHFSHFSPPLYSPYHTPSLSITPPYSPSHPLTLHHTPSPPPTPLHALPQVLDLSKVKHFILDECDRLLAELDMRRDVQTIFMATPHEKQVRHCIAMPCYACYTILCLVMPYYAVLCYAILCHSIP
jgi:hypothetical protein